MQEARFYPTAQLRKLTYDAKVDKLDNKDKSEVAVLIPLSAKNEARLENYAQSILDFLLKAEIKSESQGDNQAKSKDNQAKRYNINLNNFAYTLQIGREAMECRLAVMVASISELADKLQAYLNKDSSIYIEDLYVGQVKKNKDTLSVFDADEATKTLLSTWLKQGKFGKLLELWVKGFKL